MNSVASHFEGSQETLRADMDPQTMMIGVAIFVVSAIVIYLISVCSMREKTFEEVLEEQRKLQAEEQKKQKTEKDKKVRKRFSNKGKGRKEKNVDEKGTIAVDASPESESETDRLIEPEPIEPEISEPVQQTKPEKKKKEKKQRAEEISVSHQETLYEPLVKEQVQEVVTETVAMAPIHAEPPTRREQKESKRSKRQEQGRLEEQIVQEEVVSRVEEVIPLQSEPPKAESRKSKKKSTEVGAGDSAVTIQNLIQMVRKTTLTETEITTLIETITHKHGGGQAEWTKKSKEGEQLKAVRKELDAKDRALQDERQAAQGAGQKMREIRSELSREVQKFESQERQLHDKIKGLEQEKEALCLRMQHSHDQHMADVTSLRRQLDTSKVNQDQQYIQRLTEENQKLKDQVAQAQAAARHDSKESMELKITRDELSKNVMLVSSLKSKTSQLEGQLEKLQKVEASQHDTLNRKIKEVAEELRRSEAVNGSLAKERDSARSAAHQSEQELANTRNRMKDLQAQEAASRNLDQQLQESLHNKKELESRLLDLERMNKETDSKMKQLREENYLLSAQLKESKERTAGEGQEAPGAEINGEVASTGKTEANTICLEDHSKILGEKDSEITRLQTYLQSKMDELSKLTSDLDTQKQKNNALREKNWKAMDALSQMEKIAESSAGLKSTITSKDDDIKQLKMRLEKADKEKHDLVQQKEVVIVEKVTELKQQLASKDEQLNAHDNLKKDLAEKIEQIKSLQSQLESKDSSMQVEVSKIQEKERVIKELNESLTKHSAKHSAELKDLEKLRKEITAKDEQIVKLEELKSQLASKEKEVSEMNLLNQKMQDGENKLTSLSEEFEKLKKENEDLHEQISQQSVAIAKEENQLRLDDIQSLKSLIETKDKEKEALEANLKAKDKALETLQIQIKSSEAEKIKPVQTELVSALPPEEQQLLEQTVKELTALKLEKEQIITQQKEELQALTDEMKVTAAEMEKLKSEKEAHSSEKAKLGEKLVEAEAEAGKLKSSADKYTLDASKLNEDLKSKASHLEKITKELELMRSENQELRSGCAQAAAALEAAERSAEDTISHVQAELNSKVAEVNRLTKHLDEARAQNHELKQQVVVAKEAKEVTAATAPAAPPSPTKTLQDVTILTRVQEKSTFDVKHILAELEAKDVELAIMQNVLSQKEAENNQYKKHMEQVTALKEELNDRSAEVVTLTQQLHLQSQKTHELKERNTQIEKEVSQASRVTVNGKEEHSKSEIESKTREILTRLFPDIKISVVDSYSEWISTFEKEVKAAHVIQSSVDTEELEKAMAAQSRLQTQVQHYKGVLADTEGILNKLQNSVEEEERKWKSKLNTSEDDAERLSQQVTSLQEKLTSLESDRSSLQGQLSEGLANGNSRPQEIEQLKMSLAQTQRQLEREVQANKQLTQRLDAGVDSSGDGTSV